MRTQVDPGAPDSVLPARPRRVLHAGPTPGERRALRVITLASAVGATLAGTQPTGAALSDVVVAFCVGGAVAALASLARPLAWSAAAALAAAGASGPWIGVALVALIAAVAAAALPRPRWLPRRVLGATIGAAVVQTLFHLPAGRVAGNLVCAGLAVACIAVAAWPRVGELTRARLRRLGRRAAWIAGVSIAGLLLSLGLARRDLTVGIDRAQDGLAAARDGDSDDAAGLFAGSHTAFQAAHRHLDAWWAKPALLLPVVGPHAEALLAVTDAGSGLADAAATSARSARIQDLELQDGRLDLERVRSMARPLASVRAALRRAEDTAGGAGSPWLLDPVGDRVREFQDAVDDATEEAATAAQAVEVLPDILGGDGPRRYLVAFGTPAETRELGGFMGAYAVLVADDGKLSLPTTGRIRDLNTASTGRVIADRTVLPDHLLSLQPERFWQNITATPDLPTVAEVVRQMWPLTGPERLDGVLYMDPVTLASLLELTGPIRVPGYDKPLTAATAAPFLLREQYIEFPDDDRHDFLVDAAETVFDELTSGELAGPEVIAKTLAPSVRERRLLMNSFWPAEQALFERLDLDGGLPAVQGDFLSVRSSNRGQSKIDAFMHRTIRYDVTVDPQRGTAQATVAVTLRNEAPAAGLPFVVIGNHVGQPPGTNSATIAVYSPLELVDVTQGGQPIGRAAGNEYGRFRYAALVDVPAGEEVTVTFELAGPIDLSSGYHLDVIPQPLVNPDALEVTVRGTGGWFAVADDHLETKLVEDLHLDTRLRTLG